MTNAQDPAWLRGTMRALHPGPRPEPLPDPSRQDLVAFDLVAFDLLARALVHDALDVDGAPDDAAFIERVLRQLWATAAESGAGEVAIATAHEQLRSLVAECGGKDADEA